MTPQAYRNATRVHDGRRVSTSSTRQLLPSVARLAASNCPPSARRHHTVTAVQRHIGRVFPVCCGDVCPPLHDLRKIPIRFASMSQMARDACAIVVLMHACKGVSHALGHAVLHLSGL